jgi:hypothetical protein
MLHLLFLYPLYCILVVCIPRSAEHCFQECTRVTSRMSVFGALLDMTKLGPLKQEINIDSDNEKETTIILQKVEKPPRVLGS